jgi:HemX protein
MIVAFALLLAVTCYACAAALAVTPFARPIGPPVQGVVAALSVGVAAHLVALVVTGVVAHELPIAGLGPALSFVGLALAVALLLAESLVRDVTLSLIGAPLAAGMTAAAVFLGWRPAGEPHGAQGAWLASHIAVSFVGIAALATAAAAGALYLVERRELKSRRFGSVFRSFPPLDTLDRINHLGALTAWVSLTLGMVLAASYTIAYGQFDGAQIVWGAVAWLAAAALAGARQIGGWRGRRAARMATIAFGLVVTSYIAARAIAARPGHFL